MSGVSMLHLLKDWWKLIQIHQYYKLHMPLNLLSNVLLPSLDKKLISVF